MDTVDKPMKYVVSEHFAEALLKIFPHDDDHIYCLLGDMVEIGGPGRSNRLIWPRLCLLKGFPLIITVPFGLLEIKTFNIVSPPCS